MDKFDMRERRDLNRKVQRLYIWLQGSATTRIIIHFSGLCFNPAVSCRLSLPSRNAFANPKNAQPTRLPSQAFANVQNPSKTLARVKVEFPSHLNSFISQKTLLIWPATATAAGSSVSDLPQTCWGSDCWVGSRTLQKCFFWTRETQNRVIFQTSKAKKPSNIFETARGRQYPNLAYLNIRVIYLLLLLPT